MSADGPAPLVARLTARTQVGVGKTRNEDSIGFAGKLSVIWSGRTVELQGDVSRGVMCVVADGAGGHPAGDQASRLVVAEMLKRWAEVRSSEQLDEAIVRTHRELHEAMKADQDRQGMGSTVAVLSLAPQGVFTGNVGDSGIFEIDPQGILALSVADNPRRAAGEKSGSSRATLTQILGGPAGMAAPRPHLGRYPIEGGMRFLVCSDGLTNALPETDIGVLVHDPARCDVEIIDALVESAIAAGAEDDVSVILATVAPAGSGTR